MAGWRCDWDGWPQWRDGWWDDGGIVMDRNGVMGVVAMAVELAEVQCTEGWWQWLPPLTTTTSPPPLSRDPLSPLTSC